MDEVRQINNEMEPPANKPKNRSKLLAILLGLSVFCMIGLAIALWWCLWLRHPETPGSMPAPGGSTAAAGPCFEGAANELPAGYVWYENAELGYKFAYPSAWGAVTLATTPMGGSAGHYAHGTFAANDSVSFGGNATDYVVAARGGMPTDNPGYLQAGGAFYRVQLWSLGDGVGVPEPQHRLYKIEEGSPTLKDGCNAKALVTQHPLEEFTGYAWDTAAFNLQPTNPYYGVNIILKNPTADSRAEFDKVIRSFQLIP